MSATRLFACLSCGHHFELSRVLAESSVSMTLCPRCSGHEVETLGEGDSGSTAAVVSRPAAVEPGSAEPVRVRPAGEDAA